ncbi:MAG TPA: hypothetical protein VEC01_18360 [Noviherbaspirillum sp.]|uniref:hypothetical protein n=1 Tax=Noviherbaspirillum sp. TaxID=1926288 RepID=UPI002D29ECE2|nr:hypothetical protein [Noviherbaspirillum sp.]HYD97294.1 hypothetical protein [Noviherbaspirillum sp.]
MKTTGRMQTFTLALLAVAGISACGGGGGSPGISPHAANSPATKLHGEAAQGGAATGEAAAPQQ